MTGTTFDIQSIVTDKVKLKEVLIERGAQFTTDTAFKCPAHEDRHASAGIFCGQDGHWRAKCQVCGWGGDALDLLKEAGRDPLKENRRQTTAAKTGTPKVQTGERIKSYLEKLGVIEAVHKYTDAEGKAVFYVGRVRQADGGKDIRPFRPVEGGFVWGLPPAPRVLYNRLALSSADTIVVVEGEKCVDCLAAYGVTATTSVGGAKNAKHSDWQILTAKNVVTWPDNDDEGRGYAQDVAKILSELTPAARVTFIDPAKLDLEEHEDCADLVEQLKALGKTEAEIKDELHRIINSAKPCRPSEGLCSFFEQVASGELESIPLPFKQLTECGRPLLPSLICLLCGTPGSGKSFFVLQCMLHWLTIGVRFACYMLEESLEHHLQRAIAILEDMPEILDMRWLKDNAAAAAEWYRKHADTLDALAGCIKAIPERQETYGGLLAWAESKVKQGTKLLIIDPITAVEQHEKPWIYDAQFLFSLRRLVVEHKATALIATHPRKGQTAPGLDDLAGGAAWQRFTQGILWIQHHKEAVTESVVTDCGRADIALDRTIHICKGRNAPGVGHRIGFTFGGASVRFAEQGLILKKDKGQCK